MIGGIDSQVRQRVEAYRSNPQALAQQYQQNQQLIDLLALQKLKSEKEAAAREMQMKMQGPPGTIAEQREQQVKDLTQQEVAQKLQGSVPTMEQGIGGLPAAPMPPQAQQGIASFQKGGEVDVAEGEDEESLAYRLGRRLRPNLDLDFDTISRMFGLPVIPAAIETVGPPLRDFGRGIGLLSSEKPAPAEEPAAAAPEGEDTVEVLPDAGLTAPAAPAIDQGADFLALARSLMKSDPAAERRAERAAAKKEYSYTPEELAQLREGLDPRSRAWDQFRAFARGAVGTGSGLGALVGGSAASQAENLRQREGLAAIINANRGIREKAFGAGDEAFRQAAGDRRQGLATGQREIESRRRAATDQLLAQNERLFEMAKFDAERAAEVRAEAIQSLSLPGTPYYGEYQEAVKRYEAAVANRSKADANLARADMQLIIDKAIGDIIGPSSQSSSRFGQVRPVGG